MLAVAIIIGLFIIPSVAALDFTQQSGTLETELMNYGIISGIVRGLPLDMSGPQRLGDAKIILIHLDLENFGFVYKMATSGSNGYYYFNQLPINRYAILAIKPGYLPAFRTVKLTGLRPFRHNIHLYMIQTGGATKGYQEYLEHAMEIIPEDQTVLFNGYSTELVQTQNGLLTYINLQQ
jgi:hypothetical protein